MKSRSVFRLSRQILWMGVIWTLSVSTLAVLAGLLRILMSAAGMTS
ncbi:DUF2474 domain-containing protein [Rhizobium sp. CNPSo 3968]|nr:DUF2474 domain-containing protein [Rhizobium sp. CNPSo 3968]MDK4717984.1 DUF2474 domain-containing protein [Rhizobium sp. CNPSo 3968]